jgi:hypothetical protein
VEQRESPIALQADTLSTLPIGVRTVVVKVPVNGVLTDMQVQVVAICDSAGNVLDSFTDRDIMADVCRELRGIRKLLAMQMGVPHATFEPLSVLE